MSLYCILIIINLYILNTSLIELLTGNIDCLQYDLVYTLILSIEFRSNFEHVKETLYDTCIYAVENGVIYA